MPARATALAAGALIAGCAGPEPEPPPEAVVRAWASALARGDPGAAADRFAIPAVVANAGPATRLVTRRAVRYFNETLPCGADPVAIRHVGGLVLARLRLTERPGGACGRAAGQQVTVLLKVDDGRIAEWRRVAGGARSPAA